MYLLDQLKFKKMTIPNAGEDEETQGLSYIAGRNEKWYLQPL